MTRPIEKELADVLASTMTEEQQQRWEQCHVAHRFVAYKGKELVAYKEVDGKPQLLDTFTCVDVQASLTEGLSSTWARSSGELVWVGQAPSELVGECFLWHAFDAQVRFGLFNSEWSLSFPLVLRVKSNPHYHKQGHTQLVERHAYNALFGYGA